MLVLAFWDSLLQYLQFFRPQADFGVGVGVGHQAVSAVSAAERAACQSSPLSSASKAAGPADFGMGVWVSAKGLSDLLDLLTWKLQ